MGLQIQLFNISKFINNGQHIFVGTACAEPQMLIQALHDAVKVGELSDLHILVSFPQRTSNYFLSMAGCTISTILPGVGMNKALMAGRINYFPGRLSQIPHWFRQKKVPLDVALVQVSPPDEEGYCSLGISVDYTKAAIESAAIVIAEVNKQMPRTIGDTLVHMDDLDYMVTVDYPLSSIESKPPGSEPEIIGHKIIQLLPEQPTLEVGIGAIGDAVANALLNNGVKNIRLHTGMLTDAWMRLIQAGSILEPAVATMLLGSDNLYQFANLNSQVRLYPCDHTHDPCVIAKLPRFCAINFALEVDLTGQVNAETLNGKQIGGMGGQADFVVGANLNPEGISIIALSATARGGTISRIVTRLDPGTAITTLRCDVDYVVTEFGIASLSGKTVSERKKELIRIAHPRFREELEKN